MAQVYEYDGLEVCGHEQLAGFDCEWRSCVQVCVHRYVFTSVCVGGGMFCSGALCVCVGI